MIVKRPFQPKLLQISTINGFIFLADDGRTGGNDTSQALLGSMACMLSSDGPGQPLSRCRFIVFCRPLRYPAPHPWSVLLTVKRLSCDKNFGNICPHSHSASFSMGWRRLDRRSSGLAKFVSPEGRLWAPIWYLPKLSFGITFCFSGSSGPPASSEGGRMLCFLPVPLYSPPAPPAFIFTRSTWDSLQLCWGSQIFTFSSPLCFPQMAKCHHSKSLDLGKS